MERRNWSLKALNELQYADSLDDNDRALALERWGNRYLQNDIQETFDLDLIHLQQLSELFFRNINFLKNYRFNIKQQLDQGEYIKRFFS